MTAPNDAQPPRSQAAGSDAAGEPSGSGPTGNARVDEALATLAASADLPPAEQIPPLAEAQRTLRETLDSIGDA